MSAVYPPTKTTETDLMSEVEEKLEERKCRIDLGKRFIWFTHSLTTTTTIDKMRVRALLSILSCPRLH